MKSLKLTAATMPPIPTDQRPHNAIPQQLATLPTGAACPVLHGQCETHENDHGEIIHRSPERRESVGDVRNILGHHLASWSLDSEPLLSFGCGGEYDDLNLAQTDELIAAVEKQLASLCESRRHLAAAIQWRRLASGTPLAVVRADWPRIIVKTLTPGDGACGGGNYRDHTGPLTVVTHDPLGSPIPLQTYIEVMIGDCVQYTPQVAEVLSGFEAVRRASPDPKIVEFWDEVEQQVIAADDPKATFAALTELVHAENAGQPVTA